MGFFHCLNIHALDGRVAFVNLVVVRVINRVGGFLIVQGVFHIIVIAVVVRIRVAVRPRKGTVDIRR